MSTNSREGRKRAIAETIPGRIPKKNRSRSDSNGSCGDSQREEEGAVPEQEEDELDPVAAARKALEMFQEVSGESVVMHKDKHKQNYSDARSGDNNHGDSETTPDARHPSDEEQAEEERQKAEEEKEKQRKRIEAGEAKRREFRPRIVGLQESNCLL
eukprot:jgi/Psemu1/302911/fgenesh1_kg.85_\